MPPGVDDARWSRLVRYANWRRSGRCAAWLMRLPDDILHVICSYLDGSSLCALLEADCGYALDAFRNADALIVPHPLRSAWHMHHAMRAVQALLHDIADVALYHARCNTRIVAYADWSPFTPRIPQALAEYEWRMSPFPYPRANVVLHEGEMHAAIVRAFRSRRFGMHVTLYKETPFGGTHNRPTFMTCTLLRASP